MKFFLSLFLVTIAVIHTVRAARIRIRTGAVLSNIPKNPTPYIWYELIDNSTAPLNSRFEHEIGRDYALETLVTANGFVLKTLDLNPSFREGYGDVLLVVESFWKAGIGYFGKTVSSTVGNNIRINSDYLQFFDGDVKSEFTGILYHESTRVWQWTGNGKAPIGLITGVADYVRLEAGWPSVYWRKLRSGSRWDQGYEVTAYFLKWCNKLCPGFVRKLNGMMKDGYSDDFFVVLLGKNVDELWSEYLKG